MKAHPNNIEPKIMYELLAIAVEPARQGLGIGELLMREAIGKAQKLEGEMVTLHTAVENRPAQRLFTKCGFVPSGIKKHFYPKGQDALMMYREV